MSTKIKDNESQLRTEEAKLSGTRREFNEVREQIRLLESQQEPEPTDVIALVSLFASHNFYKFALVHSITAELT